MAELEVIEGVKAGARYPVDGVAMIGRSLTNSICLPDKSASRQHARILDRNGDFFLEDMKSANGTYLCGQAIPVGKQVALYDGDEVKICSTRMIF
ncbi:MAG: FHA domain-containing protein, partial [Planctomycetes bacterium]|nr:FHA domain-containing protein [Planctomycetota bacterium]